MDHDFIQRAFRVFTAAVDLPVAEQAAFVRSACGDDGALRARVQELLSRAASEAGQDLVAPQARSLEPLRPGVELGDFVLREELGRGGMGVVWLADQKSLSRPVALKLIGSGLWTPESLRRLEREAAILGRLQHPGIASVHAVGSAIPDGMGPGGEHYFFAMEYVRGEPLDDHVERRGLGLRDRLALVAEICDAVDHAHTRGVVHRDLKPDNILVTADGRPKVLDFGIARVTSADVLTMTMQTAVGQLIGTVPYMSPEQVLGDPARIDARSDVYSLGAVLYRLLSGRLPVDVNDRSIPEAARIIRDEEPTRLGTVATTCRGDVEAIAHMALDKEPARRYQTAAALAADIRRFLGNEPIVARRVTTLYQLRKFARRHKGLVAGLLATFVVLVIGTAVATALAVRANANAASFERAAYSQSLMVAAAALADHDVDTAERALQAAPAALRGWEWRHLESRLDMSLWAFPMSHGIAGSWFSDDDRTVSHWVEDDLGPGAPVRRFSVQSWDLATGERLADRWPVEMGANWPGLSVYGGWGYADGGTFHIWTIGPVRHLTFQRADLALGEVPDVFAIAAEADRIAWRVLPKTWQELSGALAENRTYLADFGSGRLGTPRLLGPGVPWGIRADGRRVAGFVRDFRSGEFEVWDETRGAIRFTGHADYPTCFRATPDWRRIVTGSQDGTVRTWDGETGAPLAHSQAIDTVVTDVAISRDGDCVASSSDDSLVRLWHVSDLAPRAILHGHRAFRVGQLALSGDGSLLASYTGDGGRHLRIWDAKLDGDPWALRGHTSFVYGVAVDPSGRLVASGSWDRTVRLWDARTLRPIVVLDGARSWVGDVAFSPDGARLAAIDNDRHLLVWDVADPAHPKLLRQRDDYDLDRVMPITWHPDGVQILMAVADDTVRVLDLDADRVRTEPLAFLRGCRSGVVSGDGTRFFRGVAPTWNGIDQRYAWLALCATDTGRELARTVVDTNAFKFAFSPLGAGPLRVLVPFERPGGGGWECGWRLLDGVTGAVIAEGDVGSRRLLALGFSPDGRRFVTAGYDCAVRIWDSAHFDELVQLQGHGYYVFRVAFAPDGERIYSAGGDGAVRVWGTTPLRETLLARRQR